MACHGVLGIHGSISEVWRNGNEVKHPFAGISRSGCYPLVLVNWSEDALTRSLRGETSTYLQVQLTSVQPIGQAGARS